ncbi:uncharacterized protein LOC124131924 isoform X2 [Haliotis rufescens]|uniref:uncharacterized protein LOC124131924 isoform X2 n=1 Tax=Haliotis rufescens TaxID=6454 RepID=UPI00201F813E|nr:uncharacterized protein LOC124131924 isoform X2 [Haliotis rufescens]
MSDNLRLITEHSTDVEKDGMNLDIDHLQSAAEARLTQPDIQSGDIVVNLQDCRDGITTSTDNLAGPLETFAAIETNMESLTSGGMPAAEHAAGISDMDGTEDTGHRPCISSSRLSVSSVIRAPDTNKYSGWFQCSDCGQKVKGKAKLRSHVMLLHNGSKGSSVTQTVLQRKTSWLKCGVCGERVRGKKNLSLHGFFAHKGQTRIKNIVKKMRLCSSINSAHSTVVTDSTSHCNNSVTKSKTDFKHLRLGPWFKCRSCEHIFKGRSQLQEHVRLKHQDLNPTHEVLPSIPKVTHCPKSDQSQGSVDRKLMDDAVPELVPECPVENRNVESGLGFSEQELLRKKHRIWCQCDLCGIKVKGRKRLQRHLSECKCRQQSLRTDLGASEASCTVKHCSWFKCKHCCGNFRGRKTFMQHTLLCMKALEKSTALWHKLSHWKQCAWYKCTGCRLSFKGKERIRLHAYECLTQTQTACPSIETGSQTFEKRRSKHSCKWCHKEYQRRIFLEKHMSNCKGRLQEGNLSELQESVEDVRSRKHRLRQEQGEGCQVEDGSVPDGQDESKDESRSLSDRQACDKTDVDIDVASQQTLVFLQDGSWYKCEICGQNLRGKEQMKRHSHDQKSKKTENEKVESEFLRVGTWHKCKVCGKKVRGKKQLKNHSHDQKIVKPEDKQQEVLDIPCLESEFLQVGTWHRCKICGKNMRSKEQVQNHSHDQKIVKTGDEKPECPSASPPCLESNFLQVGVWYSCKGCGKKLQGRKQMQAHSHSQLIDKKVLGDRLDSDIQKAPVSLEADFVQTGSWYKCRSCLVRFRGRHNAEVHHHYKSSLGDGREGHKEVLPEHQPELNQHCGVSQGQEVVSYHDVQPASHEAGQDMHQSESDVQRNGETVQYVNQTESSTVPDNLYVRDYIIKAGKNWECRICSKMIRSWVGSFKHVRSHFTRTTLVCSVCNKSFSSSWNRKKHEQKHIKGNTSSALKKCNLKKSSHSGSLQRKSMDPSTLKKRNKQKSSKPITASDYSPTTKVLRPGLEEAVDHEDGAENELTMRSCDVNPSSKESLWTSSAGNSAAGAYVADAYVKGASVTNASVTNPSVSNASVTNASVTNASVTNASVTNASVTNVSVVDASVVDASVTNASVADASVTNASVEGASGVDAYMKGAPVVDAFVTNVSVKGTSVTGDNLEGAADVDAVEGADEETPTLSCYRTSEDTSGPLCSDKRDKWNKKKASKGMRRRDKTLTVMYLDNDSATDVSLDQSYNSDKEMTSELCNTSENERLSVEDVECDDWILFSEYEDDGPQENVCIDELFEEQQNKSVSDGTKVCSDTEYQKLYQAFLDMSSEMNGDPQVQKNNNQEHMDVVSMNSLNLNVGLSDEIDHCHTKTLLERADTPSPVGEAIGLNGSQFKKDAMVQDTDLIMTDICRHPDMAWSDDEIPPTENPVDMSMDYETHRRKEGTLNISRRRISQDGNKRSKRSLIHSEMSVLQERFDSKDSAKVKKKNFSNSVHGNKIATNTKCKMNTICKPKKCYDKFRFQLMTSGDGARWRKRKQVAPKQCAGEMGYTQISNDGRTLEGHGRKAILQCSRTSSGQMVFGEMSAPVIDRKKPTRYKTGNEFFLPEQKMFAKRQEEKRHLKDGLGGGDTVYGGGQGRSVKDSCRQVCDRSADRGGRERSISVSCSQVCDRSADRGGRGRSVKDSCSQVCDRSADRGGRGRSVKDSCRQVCDRSADRGGQGRSVKDSCSQVCDRSADRGGQGRSVKDSCSQVCDRSADRGGQGRSVKDSCSQVCDRSADKDQESRQGRFVCSLCYKAFASETVAVDHLKQHSRHRKNRARNIRKKTIFNVMFKKHCRVCQRVFSNQVDLKRHEHSHSVEDTVGKSKDVRCEVCGEVYRTQLLLDQHKVGHQVWLKCSHCNLYFAQVTELHQHCMVARHFVCECGEAFISYAKLDMHKYDCMYTN